VEEKLSPLRGERIIFFHPSPLRDCVVIIFFDGAEKNGLLK
jgi:hypothetical protein